MGRLHVPESLRRFVERQTTMPIADLWDGDRKERHSPYGSHWYRAVACILLSGRVHAKNDGAPNMTDVNRIGKEANFNQHLTERVGKLLVAMGAVRRDRQGRYEAGPNLAAFWNHDVGRLPTITRQAVLHIVQRHTGYQAWRPTTIHHAHLIEFLVLFFACFWGRALVESRVGQVFHDFGQLPKEDLIRVAQELGLKEGDVDSYGWKYWLDDKGQRALVDALYEAEWAYYTEREGVGWFFTSPIGLGMLGLEGVPPAPDLATVFKALPDLSVFAGAGLAWETLVPLFRYGTIRRIDQVYEFRLDRKRLAELPSTRAPGEELREVLRPLEPLPSTVADLLATKSKVGRKIGIRWCSALVKPESAEVAGGDPRAPAAEGLPRTGSPARLPAAQEPLGPRQLRPAVPGPGLRGALAVGRAHVGRLPPVHTAKDVSESQNLRLLRRRASADALVA